MRWYTRPAHWARDAALAAGWLLRYRPGAVPVGLSDGDRAPVLLIPGVYEPWQFLLPVGRRLHEAGHPVHVVPELGRNVMPIADAAALAQRYLAEHDLRGVVIVAHSKGGLIGKHMMAIDDADGRIDRLVAITSPFAGSELARYAPGRVLRDFRPTAEPLASLAGNREPNARIVSVYSSADPVIPGRSVLEGATNLELPAAGHFRILVHPELLEAVARAVDPE